MLIPASALLCQHSSSPGPPGDFGRSTKVIAVEKLAQGGTPTVTADREVLRRKAEAAFDKAVALRQKQTKAGLIAAITLLQQAARLYQVAASSDKAADLYLEIGEIYFTLSRFQLALDAYHRALELNGKNPGLRCSALSRMARTYANQGHDADAETASEQALTSCLEVSNPAVRAEADEARGEVLYWNGSSVQSREFFTRARALFAEVKDDNGQALSLLMLAYTRFAADRTEALQLAAQALRLWTSKGNDLGIARARKALAEFAITTGEFETAECNCRQAQRLFHEIGDEDNEAVVRNVRGKVQLEVGDPRASLGHYKRARAAFAVVNDLLGGAEATTGMEKALAALHRYKELLPLYEAKLRLAQRANNPVLKASALADMAALYEAKHQYARAEEFYSRALAEYRALQHAYGEGDVLIGTAHLRVAQGRHAQAISLLEESLRLKEQEKGTGQVEEVAKIQYELAYIYRRLNQLQDALAAIEKPIDFIESQRLTISQFDSRASYFASVHRYYALYIQVLMLLHDQDPQAGFAQRAFAAAEKSKVRSLLDLLITSRKIAPCEDLLKRQVAAREVRALDPAETSAAAAAAPLSLEEVQSEIGSDDTALLEYALGDEKSYLWVVDQRQIVSYELPGAAKIQRAASLVRDTLVPLRLKQGENGVQLLARRRAADLAYPRYARQLSQLVLAPAELAHAKRLLIVPDGLLQYIPFAALPVPAGREILIEHHELVVLPSASALGTLRKAAAKRAPPSKVAAIFADPVFGRDDERLLSRRSGKQPQKLPSDLTRAILDINGSLYVPRLIGSRQEAKAIQDILGRKDVLVASGFAATRDRFLKEDIGSYRILHVATHGIIDIRNPEMSGLILSLMSKGGRPKDGYVRLGDIYHLKLSADLVILSACDSALGRDLDSEGIIGLPRGFLYAGARSVIASLWKVNDQATATLMAGLYRRMRQGETPGAALRGAQLEMARQGRKPADWAAFVLLGDYK